MDPSLAIAAGGKVIKCRYPLDVIKYTYDHSCYLARWDEYQHFMTLPPTANRRGPAVVLVLRPLVSPLGLDDLARVAVTLLHGDVAAVRKPVGGRHQWRAGAISGMQTATGRRLTEG